jgi:hypothetical protein
MILTTHALTGAAIGKNFGNIWLVIGLSLVVHFIMDSLRHGEYFDSRFATVKNTAWKITLDLIIGSAIILSYFYFKNPSLAEIRNIMSGAFFSLLPDGLTLLGWKFPRNKILAKIRDFHSWTHRYGKFPKYSYERQWSRRNALNDLAISAIAIAILFLI